MHSARPPNRLARSSSPYLLQHAHNPVDWYPWGEEAFAAARERNIPIFLSIGYSTCYWCHVMERESFESETIGAQLKRDFIAIKLDREERPDLDDLYMAATLVTQGRGGWPMSVFLEPDGLRPFWCGTYFPPAPARGMPGFPQILDGIADAWKNRRDQVLEQAQTIAQAVAEQLAAPAEPVPIGPPEISKAIQSLLTTLDRTNGGFGGAPKFPQPAYIEFLLDARPAAADDATKNAIDHALKFTLDRMAIGGIFDHLAGGFHRYAVDATWTVPHFEKMLYDNALLATCYARASVVYGDSFYADVARQTLDYILREMTLDSSGGAFASAQDAEVDGQEGLNYLWTPDQVRAALPNAAHAELAIKHFGLDRGPNFQDPHHPGSAPSNVLRLDARPDQASQSPRHGLERIRAQLLATRATRIQPRRDDKAITEWNAMMIAAMATAGRLLSEPRYTAAAVRAIEALHTATTAAGELPRASRDGRHALPAVLGDYAWLIFALAETARTLQDSAPRGIGVPPVRNAFHTPEACLTWASELADQAHAHFADPHTGRYFDTRRDQPDLFLRTTATYDGATPSGASTMLHALLALVPLKKDANRRTTLVDRLLGLLAWLSPTIADRPVAVINATRALLNLLLGASGGDLPRTLRDRQAREANDATGEADRKQRPHARADFTPIEIYADTDRIAPKEGEPAKFRLSIKIAPGYHLIAAEPRPAQAASSPSPTTGTGTPLPLTPLRVGFIPGSGTGISVYADYLSGSPYSLGGEVILVHNSDIEFDVVVERIAKLQGRPILGVTFQACSDTECLVPRTVELDVAIDEG